MNYNDLIAKIAADFIPGVPKGINAEKLNGILNEITKFANETRGDYQGSAAPTDNPGTPTTPVYYIAESSGTYTNFGSLVVDVTQGVNYLSFVPGDGWSKTVVPVDLESYALNYDLQIQTLKSDGLIEPLNLLDTKIPKKFSEVDRFTSSNVGMDIVYDASIKDVRSRILVNTTATAFSIFQTPYVIGAGAYEVELFATYSQDFTGGDFGIGIKRVSDGLYYFIRHRLDGRVQEYDSANNFILNIQGTPVSAQAYTNGARTSLKISVREGITRIQTSVNGVYSAVYESAVPREWGDFRFMIFNRCSYSVFSLFIRTAPSLIPPIEVPADVLTEPKIINVSKTTGNDGNDGISSPVQTIPKGISLLKPGFKLRIAGGDYRETIDFNLVPTNCEIYADEGQLVRILGSDKITGWAKTSGYTNVYQINTTKPEWPSGFSGGTAQARIFQDATGSLPVTTGESNFLNRGRVSRLPYTQILSLIKTEDLYNSDTEVLSVRLSQLDLTPSSFYYSGSTLYIHCAESANPDLVAIEIARRSVTSTSSTTGKNIYKKNIGFFYSRTGIGTGVNNYVKRVNVRCFGVIKGNGFEDYNCFVESFYDEAADVSGDGVNGHFENFPGWDSSDLSQIQCATYIAGYYHDNFDDGFSHHSRSLVCMDSCVAEHNRDNGIICSNTNNSIIRNTLAKYNGSIASGGLGVGIGHSPSKAGVDQALGGNVDLYNCLSIGNFIGYEPGINSRFFSCVSRNNTNFEYKVRSNRRLEAYDCKGYNANPALIKSVDAGGVLSILNTNLLT